MQRSVITTADGSSTIEIPEMQVTYHSRHGAIQESMHVYITAGLNHLKDKHRKLSVLEVGFGTGLNAFLTLLYADTINVDYTALEPYPLLPTDVSAMNYTADLSNAELFEKLHQAKWNSEVAITDRFTLEKVPLKLQEFTTSKKFHLVYYDAFAPAAQPELWTEDIFKKIYEMVNDGGVLVTYCSKSIVRRAMIAAGFTVSKLPGPRGKREMLRAEKR
jgi:tRNA U34 5-methylaminomethyl-2-thiouridine-forming methyltransferase MnmC